MQDLSKNLQYKNTCLVLYPEYDLLGVVAHPQAEELVPLRAEVVVDHLREEQEL